MPTQHSNTFPQEVANGERSQPEDFAPKDLSRFGFERHTARIVEVLQGATRSVFTVDKGSSVTKLSFHQRSYFEAFFERADLSANKDVQTACTALPFVAVCWLCVGQETTFRR